MNQNGKIKGIYSWPIIIIAFCIFWPVGVVLLVGRVSRDKKTAMSVGRIVNGIAITSYVIAALGLAVCLGEGFAGEDIGMILFFGIAGVVLQRVAKRIKNDAENVKRYLSIIINGKEIRLDNIAAATGKPYAVVKADIEKLINKGYLKDAYINESTGEVILPNRVEATANVNNDINRETTIQTRVVTCKCCGAQNTISSTIGECEYCGSPLN